MRSALVLSGVATGIFAIFTWAALSHFVSAGMQWGMRLISAVAVLTLVLHLTVLWTAPAPPGFQLAGAAMQGLAALLFGWGVATTWRRGLSLAFEQDEPQALISDGPFRFIRHPFYASYALFWLGCGLASLSGGVGLGAVVLVALYWRAARLEEASFARSALADTYARYRRGAGLMWPRSGASCRASRQGEAG